MGITAFVARSFHTNDVERIRPILDFLDTFRKAGFIWEEAEAAEVEPVSTKVRKMIHERDVFVGFLTRKHPIYQFGGRISTAIAFALGKVSPAGWTAPAWVVQESGYALSANKSLILLREDGVEIPGLQADLEYIPFNPANPSAVFPKISEMINDLLAKASGREVKTEIVEARVEAEDAPQPTEEATTEKLVSTEEHAPAIIECHLQMQTAVGNHDLGAAERAWEAGRELIRTGHAGGIDARLWDCAYFESRYEAGDPDGLEQLRRMHRENPQHSQTAAMIARILASAGVHDEAADFYLRAAATAQGNSKSGYLASAAKQFNALKKFDKGIAAAEDSLAIATGDVRIEAISVLYELVKNSGELHYAFARAEAFLHDNPQLRLRFELGLDYRRHGNKELAFYHFKFLHDRTPEDGAALHNLALLYSDCELPINSVDHYRRAIPMGETLSSANLAYNCLDAGMKEEAKQIIQDAMAVEPHDSRVDACWAELSERTQKESDKASEIFDAATSEIDFYVSMGKALRSARPAVDGTWSFPFGEIILESNGNIVSGVADLEKPDSRNPFGTLYGVVPAEQEPPRLQRYSLEGTLTGAACRFILTISERESSHFRNFASILAGMNTRTGLIVFAPDARSGLYAEVESEKLKSRETITFLKR